MTEPLRWLHDERVPPALRGMLATSSGDVAFPDDVRLRVAQRIAAATATSLAVLGAAEIANAAGSASAASASAGAVGTGAVGVGAGAVSTGAGLTTAAGIKVTAAFLSIALGAAVTTTAVVQHERERVVSVAAPVAAPLVEKARALEEARAARRVLDAPRSTLALRPIGELPVTVDELPPAAPTEEPRVAGRAAPGNSFEHEVSELRALRVLVKQSPAEALSRLRATADGQFAAERRLLEVQALLSLGRDSEAAAVGERMLADPAASWYHERVRSLVGKSSAPPKDLTGPGHSLPGSNVKEDER